MRHHAAAKAARGPYVEFASGQENPPAGAPSQKDLFSAWLDDELETLEQRWSHFQTSRSIKHSLNR